MTSSEHELALKNWLRATDANKLGHLQLKLDNINQIALNYCNSQSVNQLQSALVEIIKEIKFSQYGVKP